MEPPQPKEDDFAYWKYHPSGRYTVKSGYYYLSKNVGLEESSFVARDQLFVKLIWRMQIQPKWKWFLWRLFHDGIAVKTNLARRGVPTDTVFDYCRNGDEDNQNLFRFCIQARDIWDNSSLNIFHDSTDSSSLRRWIQHHILLFHSEDGRLGNKYVLFIATLWGLWNSRNERCFRGMVGTTSRVREIINLALKDHEIFLNQDSMISEHEGTNEGNSSWPPGFFHVQLGKEKKGFDGFIVEVDGSWDKNTTRAGIGWVVKADNHALGREEGGK
ncbi:uncharacterized protein LOC110719933 [Chenopodium quinoa]|uniref:uncharacterized protein LOC110719933 n=1 Tax=Chenopodium quinoa TaxID=63459 RepID=UPI000B795D43|nr:uncharacterized protein LOC110719933 [Chenopodium quinoa]